MAIASLCTLVATLCLGKHLTFIKLQLTKRGMFLLKQCNGTLNLLISATKNADCLMTDTTVMKASKLDL